MEQPKRFQTRRQVLRAAVGGAAGLLLGAPGLRLPEARAQAASASGTVKLADDLFIVRMQKG